MKSIFNRQFFFLTFVFLGCALGASPPAQAFKLIVDGELVQHVEPAGSKAKKTPQKNSDSKAPDQGVAGEESVQPRIKSRVQAGAEYQDQNSSPAKKKIKESLLIKGISPPRLPANIAPEPAQVKQDNETGTLGDEQTEKIVAIVNHEALTLSELQTRVRMFKLNVDGNEPQEIPEEQLRKVVLERMIIDAAQLQLAKSTGVFVSDEHLNGSLEEIAQSQNQDFKQFKSSIEQQGLSFEAFREEIRKEITVARLRSRQVRIQVSEYEIDNYLTLQGLSGDSEEYRVAHVLIRVTDEMSDEKIQQQELKAMQMIKRLRAGQQFSDLVSSFSDAPDAKEGGDLGWRPLSRLPNVFHDAVLGMQVDGYSELIRSPAGFHLLYLLDKRSPQSIKQIEQTRASHILIKTNEVVSDEEALSRLQVLRQRLIQGESFADLARSNSQDGSASKGGDLGWLYPGDTVPEFEQAMSDLRLGGLSKPIKTRFGYHLIQVQDRRVADVSDKRRRENIRQTLYQRKKEEVHEEWLLELRDRTYIENRLEQAAED